MSDLPEFIESGEKARLFPVLSDSSKEGRATSILLACMFQVPEFAQALLADLGVRTGPRTRIETYREVCLKGSKLRPDGMIVVTTGKRTWTALIEAKIGNRDLEEGQIEDYLELAKAHSINALITISNQFAPLPSHHPLSLSASSLKKAELYHWSWMHVLTESSLLLQGEQALAREKIILIGEFVRFLTHSSAGVKGFDQMPKSWKAVTSVVQSGGKLAANNYDTKDVIGAWHQEARDLSLILARQLGCDVTIKASRAHANDPVSRIKHDAGLLCQQAQLQTVLSIPDAAAPVEVSADLQIKTITVSMRLKAPEERKSTKARTSWLLRQIKAEEAQNIFVRMFWPGRGPYAQYALKDLQDNPGLGAIDKPNAVVTSFEICAIWEIGNKFNQPKKFISELERIVPEYYEKVGQNLKSWRPSAPRIKEDKTEAEAVSVAAIGEDAEAALHTQALAQGQDTHDEPEEPMS